MAAGVHVVWFKRDLRTRDHEPLQRALQAAAHSGGKVLLLQVFEPGLLAHPTTSSRHVQFQWECGDDIQFTLKQEGWGLTLHRVCAPALSVLEHLRQTVGVAALHSAISDSGVWWYTATRSMEDSPARVAVSRKSLSHRCFLAWLSSNKIEEV